MQEKTTDAVDVTENAVVVSHETAQPSVVLQGDPERQLAFAKKASQALVSVISAKQKKVIIGGEQYLEFEDWQTLGRFYGITVGVERTNEIRRDGLLFGYEAKAVVYQNGVVISGAEAMCCRDEEKWGSRAKYEWRDGQRVKVGEELVPEFQLRSMAQTRASAKALRNVLAWVVVMAGYKATPAEEMDGVQVAPAQERQSTGGGYSGGGYAPKQASEKQVNFVKSLVRELGHDDAWFENDVHKKPYNTLTSSQASKYIEVFQAKIKSLNKGVDKGDEPVIQTRDVDVSIGDGESEGELKPGDIPF